MFQGYQYVMWAFPFCQEGFRGVSWGLGASALEMSYAHSCTFFVVHYVSNFDYDSDYYSSSYSGIFWDSIFTDSLETPELDTSLEEADAIPSSVSSGFLHMVSTLSDNSKPQLAPSIHTHKLWCQASTLLVPVSLATKMSASKLIHYFSSHPAAFGFWASTSPDNISLNSANRKVDQSLSDFQTGLGAAAHATLDTEQLISHLQVALVDTFSSLPEAEGMLYLCLKCVNYFSGFMAFWTRMFPRELEIQHVF